MSPRVDGQDALVTLDGASFVVWFEPDFDGEGCLEAVNLTEVYAGGPNDDATDILPFLSERTKSRLTAEISAWIWGIGGDTVSLSATLAANSFRTQVIG